MIIYYSEAGMVGDALQLFDKLVQHKPCPFTQKLLCSVLSVYLANGIYDDRFHQAFNSVPIQLGVSHSVKSYNLALKAYCEAKEIDSARALIVKMESLGNVAPDIESYNLLLGAYLGKGGKNGFDEVVKEILNKGLEGNLTTYNYRILRLCRSKEGARAKKLLDEMISKGVKPNSATYDAIVTCFCKVGDFESAKKVLDRMGSDGCAWPPSYFNVMRQMVEEEEFQLALDLCKEILSRKWVPPFETMEGLVNGLVKMSKKEEAKEVVEEIKSRLKGPAADAWVKVEASLPLSNSSVS